MIGLTSTVLAALVSTAVIVSLTKAGTDTQKAFAGCFSVLAALFAAANTFLKLGELDAKHSSAVASFGQLHRKLELSEGWEKNVDKAFLEKLMIQWGNLEKNAPAIPNGIYQKAQKMTETPPK